MGNLSITKTRESLNKLKVKLINNLLTDSHVTLAGGKNFPRKANFISPQTANGGKKGCEAVTHLMEVQVT